MSNPVGFSRWKEESSECSLRKSSVAKARWERCETRVKKIVRSCRRGDRAEERGGERDEAEVSEVETFCHHSSAWAAQRFRGETRTRLILRRSY